MGSSSNPYKRIAIIGATGQLGSDLVRVLRANEHYEVVPLDHTQIEVADETSVRRALMGKGFNVVINTAAFHKVESCEEDPERAFHVNALGALHVSRACAESGAKCVYISTDYVFGGEKEEPYTEKDCPHPINVYGSSKLAGEYLVLQTAPDALILRIASVFGRAGARGKGGNFVEAILAKARAGEALRVVNDQWMSPTYTRDVAHLLDELLEAGASGIFHATNQGKTTWYTFAREALKLVGLDVPVKPISAASFPSKARRPWNSALKSVRLEQKLERGMRPWQEALRDYLKEKGYIT